MLAIKIYLMFHGKVNLFKITKPLLEFATVFSMVIVVFIFLSLNLSTGYIVTVLALFGLAAVRMLPSLLEFINQSKLYNLAFQHLSLQIKSLKKLDHK